MILFAILSLCVLPVLYPSPEAMLRSLSTRYRVERQGFRSLSVWLSRRTLNLLASLSAPIVAILVIVAEQGFAVAEWMATETLLGRMAFAILEDLLSSR